MQGLLGIVVLIGIAWVISERRARVGWRLVIGGVALQFALALLMLRAPLVSDVFELFARFVTGVIERSQAGIAFVFGSEIASGGGDSIGFVFAFNVLPIIIFFAALMGVLYHVKVMQVLISGLAFLLRRTLGVTGAEALCMAANVFVGQTEAPLTVKPLIERMTRAQLMTLMVGGFATIAGSVLGAYTGMLGGDDPERTVLFAKHLITASVISAPAAFVMARLLVPETQTPPDEGVTAIDEQSDDDELRATNVIEAAAIGATDGLKLALNVGAMLIAFLSLLALINWPLEAWTGLTLEALLGWALRPLAWLVGVEWSDAGIVGSLMGQKLLVTEFVAFGNLQSAIAQGTISDRSAQICAYALCGFANFGSLAIQIGGLSSIAPGRRSEFASLALRAMIGGALASFMTACVAGVLL
ncbi:MAG: nucleoside transporter C-terminal domain-containing protein [Phycisphaerales bacterium]